MTEASKYHVSILTHESTHIPFEETTTNLLTQFFVANMVRLHTSILVEGMHVLSSSKRRLDNEPAPERGSLVLVDYENLPGEKGYNEKIPTTAHYLKEDVASTAQFQGRGHSAQVIITLNHGWVWHPDPKNPESSTALAGLCFRCEGRGQVSGPATIVYAKEYPGKPASVTLHKIIEGCKLAILLCCNGPEVLEHYLQHVEALQPGRLSLEFPEILISHSETINTYSCEIYMVLLINIVESILDDADSLYKHMRHAIIRIMQILKLFGNDYVGFWLFLEHTGCVTDTADEKSRQELAYPPAHGNTFSFRVYGRVTPYGYRGFPERLLEDFKNIRLVCPVPSQDTAHGDGKELRALHITYENVPDITFQENDNRKIDNFLQKYKLMTQHPETPSSNDEASSVHTPGDIEPYSPDYFDPNPREYSRENSPDHRTSLAHLSPVSLLLAKLQALQF